ncbi:hypothetical protein [Azospirillum sp. B2RO_4]|uniref:hypothetical protein n=1 Tax=Azospirillum sp. B2RO_4 TaxID=3027796 RepID=UPI003DA9AC86
MSKGLLPDGLVSHEARGQFGDLFPIIVSQHVFYSLGTVLARIVEHPGQIRLQHEDELLTATVDFHGAFGGRRIENLSACLVQVGRTVGCGDVEAPGHLPLHGQVRITVNYGIDGKSSSLPGQSFVPGAAGRLPEFLHEQKVEPAVELDGLNPAAGFKEAKAEIRNDEKGRSQSGPLEAEGQ